MKVGDKAPGFKVLDQHGELINSEDLKGQKTILYFYPKDNTSGCTAESCNFRDNYEDLSELGYRVIGVSTDNVKSHDKFANKYELPFTLLADEDKSLVEAYGVWGEKKMYGRTYMGTHRKTFIIDEDWKIRHIIEKVKTKESTEQIKKLLEI